MYYTVKELMELIEYYKEQEFTIRWPLIGIFYDGRSKQPMEISQAQLVAMGEVRPDVLVWDIERRGTKREITISFKYGTKNIIEDIAKKGDKSNMTEVEVPVDVVKMAADYMDARIPGNEGFRIDEVNKLLRMVIDGLGNPDKKFVIKEVE